MSKPFGPYTLIKRIAAGAAGRVYLATGAQGRVVLKIASAKEDASFAKEARILQRLRNPHVVSVFDYGVVEGRPYLALEHVEGRDLATLLRDSTVQATVLTQEEAIVIAADTARGLHAAHTLADEAGRPLNLVHRDVSPQNILIDHQGFAKITDFGVAKLAGELRTVTGVIKGKFEYLSPEHASGLPLDRRADIFSLGLVLYEMLAHQPAYFSNDDYELIELAREANFRPLQELKATLPPALLKAVATALAVDKQRRFDTAAAFADALDATLSAPASVARQRIKMRSLSVSGGD